MKQITEILRVNCKIQKYQIKFIVAVQYGYDDCIGGKKLNVIIGKCYVNSMVPVDLFLELGDTIYSIIHQAIHEQYDLKERYDNLTAGIEYPEPNTLP